MGIILGFGQQEEIEMARIKELLHGKTFDEINSITKEINIGNAKFDAMTKEEAPERYTNVYFHGDTLRFHHINRRHALSPDGWALWIVDEPFTCTVKQSA